MNEIDGVLERHRLSAAKLEIADCELVWFVRCMRGRKRGNAIPGVVVREPPADDLLDRLSDDALWNQIVEKEADLTSIDDLLLIQRLATMRFHVVPSADVQMAKSLTDADRMNIESNVMNYCPQIEERGLARLNLMSRTSDVGVLSTLVRHFSEAPALPLTPAEVYYLRDVDPESVASTGCVFRTPEQNEKAIEAYMDRKQRNGRRRTDRKSESRKRQRIKEEDDEEEVDSSKRVKVESPAAAETRPETATKQVKKAKKTVESSPEAKETSRAERAEARSHRVTEEFEAEEPKKKPAKKSRARHDSSDEESSDDESPFAAGVADARGDVAEFCRETPMVQGMKANKKKHVEHWAQAMSFLCLTPDRITRLLSCFPVTLLRHYLALRLDATALRTIASTTSIWLAYMHVAGRCALHLTLRASSLRLPLNEAARELVAQHAGIDHTVEFCSDVVDGEASEITGAIPIMMGSLANAPVPEALPTTACVVTTASYSRLLRSTKEAKELGLSKQTTPIGALPATYPSAEELFLAWRLMSDKGDLGGRGGRLLNGASGSNVTSDDMSRRLRVVTDCAHLSEKCRQLWEEALAQGVLNTFGEMPSEVRRKLEDVVTGKRGARENVLWEVLRPLQRAEAIHKQWEAVLVEIRALSRLLHVDLGPSLDALPF